MRLFLLPISTRRTLLYAHRLASSAASNTPPTYAERITARAAKQWRKWEAYDAGWQRKVTGWGNAAFARIPFPEWGLKSVPPLRSKDRHDTAATEAAGTLAVRTPVQVIFPPHVIDPERVNGLLHRLATERQGLHRRGMYWSVAGLPVALPFGLIPVLPNLPFFYLAFRAWSHWKALRGSQHIEYLLAKDALVGTPSSLLQRVYDVRTLPPEQLKELKTLTDPLEESDDFAARETTVLQFLEQAGGSVTIADAVEDAGRERTLLDKASGKLLSRAIGVPGLDIEIERAVAQVDKIIDADRVKEEEKQALVQSGAQSPAQPDTQQDKEKKP